MAGVGTRELPDGDGSTDDPRVTGRAFPGWLRSRYRSGAGQRLVRWLESAARCRDAGRALDTGQHRAPDRRASGMTMAEQAMAGGDANGMAAMRNAMPVQILQPVDISDAIAFLVSDQEKWITGVSLPVDAGFSIR
jgi:NAD(P)-dependent dehydrogenase (short-subunit alcohol dehydrogenase family)